MANTINAYVLTEDELSALLQDQGLEHPSEDRLLSYIWLVQTYPLNHSLKYYEDNLKKWVSDEQDSYYGEHESPADFVRYYIENYCELPNIPNWLVIDYQHTWDSALRHDFHFEEVATNLGYVWAEIY